MLRVIKLSPSVNTSLTTCKQHPRGCCLQVVREVFTLGENMVTHNTVNIVGADDVAVVGTPDDWLCPFSLQHLFLLWKRSRFQHAQTLMVSGTLGMCGIAFVACLAGTSVQQACKFT